MFLKMYFMPSQDMVQTLKQVFQGTNAQHLLKKPNQSKKASIQ